MLTTEEQDLISEIEVDDCWRLLGTHQIGRLAYRLVDEVHLVPVNYATTRRRILIRTAPGNKLLAAALHSEVAFEIDFFDLHVAWSVEVRGQLRRLHEDEARQVDAELPVPWVDSPKYDVIELLPDVVSGRRFRLRPGAGRS